MLPLDFREFVFHMRELLGHPGKIHLWEPFVTMCTVKHVHFKEENTDHSLLYDIKGLTLVLLSTYFVAFYLQVCTSGFLPSL